MAYTDFFDGPQPPEAPAGLTGGMPNPFAEACPSMVTGDGRELAEQRTIYRAVNHEAIHSQPFPVSSPTPAAPIITQRMEILKLAIEATKQSGSRLCAESVIQWAKHFEAFLLTGQGPVAPTVAKVTLSAADMQRAADLKPWLNKGGMPLAGQWPTD